MTLDQADVEREIIDVLKSDGGADLPPGLDERVASRLAASAGIFGLGTAVTAGSQAAAVSAVAASATAAVGPSAAASAAAIASVPAVKLLTLGSLAKTLALGMALGSTVGLGLHASFRNTGAPAAPRRPAGALAVAPPPVATTKLTPTPAFQLSPPHLEAVVSDTPGRESPRVAGAEPRANPSPELPSDLPSAVTGLAVQQALLDDARAALRRGDGSAALTAIRRHTAQFPTTAFEEEREAVAIKALLLVGNTTEARERAARFDARFPKSLLTPSLRTALGKKGSVDSVMDPGAPSQTKGDE